jgi:hypothetical protein
MMAWLVSWEWPVACLFEVLALVDGSDEAVYQRLREPRSI